MDINKVIFEIIGENEKPTKWANEFGKHWMQARNDLRNKQRRKWREIWKRGDYETTI